MRKAIAAIAALFGASVLLSLAACSSPTPPHAASQAAPVATAASTTVAPTPGAAACSQALTLGHNIAFGYGYEDTDYPTRAVLRGWHRQISRLISAASEPRAVPADSTEFAAIDDDAFQIDLRLIPAIYTGFGNSPPQSVRSVNWNATARYASKLQQACGQ